VESQVTVASFNSCDTDYVDSILPKLCFGFVLLLWGRPVLARVLHLFQRACRSSKNGLTLAVMASIAAPLLLRGEYKKPTHTDVDVAARGIRAHCFFSLLLIVDTTANDARCLMLDA
jgi:hypothetical protein